MGEEEPFKVTFLQLPDFILRTLKHLPTHVIFYEQIITEAL